MNIEHLRGRLVGSWVTFICRFLSLLFAVPSFVFSQTFDVLIVEKPQHLMIYDSFQQSLDVTQAQTLQRFAPLKILKLHDLLSDGITACMKVEVGGDIFYLLYDENGNLAGSKVFGMVKTFRNKAFVGDTVEIFPLARLAFREPDKKTGRPLAAGDQCVRYFADAGAVYVKKLGKHSAYGWISLPLTQEGKWWRVLRSRGVQSGLSHTVIERLTGRIKKVNLTLSQIYSQLAKETGKKLPVPQWYVKSTAASVTCVFQPSSAAYSYRKSIAALTETLQTYLLGTEFDAIAVANRIEIKQR